MTITDIITEIRPIIQGEDIDQIEKEEVIFSIIERHFNNYKSEKREMLIKHWNGLDDFDIRDARNGVTMLL